MADYRVIIKFSVAGGQTRGGIFYPGQVVGLLEDSIVFTAPITKAQARTYFNNIATSLRELIVNDSRMAGIIT